jgi:hypothetical protein
MHIHLKMLLHMNGALPSFPALKSFWEKSAKEKLAILRKEMQDTNYNPRSIFSELNNFYRRLVTLTLQKCPTAFKKEELLHSWYAKLGKTCQEFMENEFDRWRIFVIQQDKYEGDVLLNLRTFDEEKVRNCMSLKDLCSEYYAKYSPLPGMSYD